MSRRDNERRALLEVEQSDSGDQNEGHLREGGRPADSAHNLDVYTVAEAIDHIGFGWFQVKMSCFAGMIWMVEAMEMMLMSFLSPAARCYFDLSDFEVALITTVVFIGFLCGSIPYGWLMDRYGRYRGLRLSVTFVGVYGILSGFAPTYGWLLFLRFFVGFHLSTSPQAMTYYSEFLPSKTRAAAMIFLEVFWSVGTMCETLLAMVVMPSLGWRYMLFFGALPSVISVLIFRLFPKSAHYLVTIGDYAGAEATLRRIAKENGKTLPSGRLIRNEMKENCVERIRSGSDGNVLSERFTDADNISMKELQQSSEVTSPGSDHSVIYQPSKETKKKRGWISHLFSSKKMAASTVLIWILWFSLAFVYYGVALLTTEILRVDLVVDGKCVDTFPSSKKHCQLSTREYLDVLWTTAAEFPGLCITFLLIRRVGRKRTIFLEMAGVTVFYGLLFICNVERSVTLFFIFGVRALITGAFQAAALYTPEIYPTHVRATGMACASTMGRFGALTTPFIAEVVMNRSVLKGKLIYTSLSGVTALLTLFFPIETGTKRLE